MKSDPAVIAAQNRQKIEKDKRRKFYHDLQVQGTNNSSIVSKRSVEMIYNPIMEPDSKEWFKHFVPKAKRRSPAINRGYWIRMESIKQLVYRILEKYPTEMVRVINLGCGFDPLPFQLLAEESKKNFQFYDFDYPELVQRKMRMIRDSPEIMEVIGKQVNIENLSSLGVCMATDSYKLVGCDLKNTSMYEKQIKELLSGLGASIFIAEVSLAYMKPEHANPVIEILSGLSNSHFLVLEQIMPSGEQHFFAQKMLYHFNHLRSPLQCVTEYSTKDKQCKRFEKYFPNVTVVDLFESWQQLIPIEKKKLIDSVEPFDEWEEFIVFCQHYVVIHATNSQHKILMESIPNDDLLSQTPISMELINIRSPLELKFPAACESQNGIYVHGGMWQTRNDDLLLEKNLNFAQVKVDDKPAPRMCHTLTNLHDGRLLLVGGRTRPGTSLNDIWLFKEDSKTWIELGNLDGYDLNRHNAISVGQGNALVFADGKFVFLSIDTVDKLNIHQFSSEGYIPNLKSCGFTYHVDSNIGYIVGGIHDITEPTFNETIYEFQLDLTKKSLIIKPILSTKTTARIGCAVHFINEKLYVVGGVGETLTNKSTTIVVMNTVTKTINSVPITDEIWQTFPVLIGFELTGSTLVGGGAVCYSFGSIYNPAYKIKFA